MSLHVHISIVGIKKKRRTDSVTREIKTNQRAYFNVLLIMLHVYEDAYRVAMICRLGLVTKESCFRRDVQKKHDNSMISNISRPRDLRKPWNLAEMKGTTHDSLQLYNTHCNILKTDNLSSYGKAQRVKCLSRFLRDINLEALKMSRKEVSTTCSKTLNLKSYICTVKLCMTEDYTR